MKTVQTYDLVTKKLASIPAAELAPGMIQAKVEGVGLVWINSAQLKLDEGEYRHPPFSEEVRDILRQLKASLDEVIPRTVEQWEDGFRKDIHAEREIAL